MNQSTTEKTQQAGLCWIKPEQWQRLLEVAEDSDRLEASWQEWEQKSLEMIDVFATRGIQIQKVEVDVEALVDWCKSKGKGVNASTRAEYVTAIMMEEKKAITGQVRRH